MRLWLLLLGSFLLLSSTEKEPYPTDYFRSPVKHTLRLSGTFGELRTNHFHAGIDIKSARGGSGDELVAAAEGYISRIKVQAGGYGNALYINHPNGYTTVYAHLSRYAPTVAAYIKEQQYIQKNFELDLILDTAQFVFQKGEYIGNMGNTGSSGGPHLHFEIRDTKTEQPINPLLFGLKVADTRKPRMNQIRVYTLNNKGEQLEAKSYDLYAAGGQYKVRGDTIYTSTKEAGVALKTYDHMNDVSNWNGVYSVELLQENQPRFAFEMNRFSFDESRYINAHLDYIDRMTKKSYFNRCFLLPGNQVNIYRNVQNRGILRLQDDQASEIVLLSKDIMGNVSTAKFWLKYRPKEVKEEPVIYNYFLPYREENAIDNGELYVHFPANSFYEDLPLNYQITEEESDNIYSAVHHLHNYLTPVHQSFDIAVKPKNLPERLKDKAFVAYCDKNGNITNIGSEWRYDRLWGKARILGDFYIKVDTIPPRIRNVSFQENMRGKSQFSFTIQDNYSSGGLAKSMQYNAYVDGEWLLMEHDGKSRRITHRFDGRIPNGTHKFRLEVKDAMGNESVFESEFTR